MTSLQQYLNHFIYAKTIDHRFIEEVKKIPCKIFFIKLRLSSKSNSTISVMSIKCLLKICKEIELIDIRKGSKLQEIWQTLKKHTKTSAL